MEWLGEFLRGVLRGLLGPASELVGFLREIAEWFGNAVEWLLCFWKQAMCWTMEVMKDGGIALITEVIGLMPQLNLDLSAVLLVARAVNAWFPLDVGIALYGGLFTYKIGFAAAKIILKLIPTIG